MDPFWGGFGLQRGHFSVKMYAKMKELGPVGGRAPARPLDPPMVYAFSVSLSGDETVDSNLTVFDSVMTDTHDMYK